MVELLVRNIGLLATPVEHSARRGAAQGDITLLAGAAVAVEDGRIVWVGPQDEAPKADEALDAGGRLVTPGLIDSHTHLVFGGWRQHEFARKLAGVPYLEILAQGGGILSTVRSTRAASFDDLYAQALPILQEMLAHGVTACEAKSGYGLTTKDELKQLEVAAALDKAQPVDLVPTFLGAHALPEEYKDRRDAFVTLVCEEMLPAVARRGLARFCDVFCEAGVFTAEETRRILRAAQALGLSAKVHADEIEAIGGSQVAGKVGAVSAEHLICSGPEEIQALAQGGVIGVLLPGTSFYLDKPYAPARAMLKAGMAVAVASDFNPGSSPSCNLQFCMNLACLRLGLSPAEALCAVTLNAAAACGLAESTGSLEVGKQADMVLWEAEDLETLFYRYGSNLVHSVMKNGEIAAAKADGGILTKGGEQACPKS